MVLQSRGAGRKLAPQDAQTKERERAGVPVADSHTCAIISDFEICYSGINKKFYY